MRSCSRPLGGLGLAVIILIFAAAPASATTYSRSFSFGANLGTLTYSANSVARTCTSEYGPVSYTLWTYYNFIYVSSLGSQVIGGQTWYDFGIGGRLVGSGNCPSDPRGPSVPYGGSGYNITISILTGSPGYIGANIIVPGYVNPKYVVLGVIYAPPQTQSSEMYGSSSLESTTQSLSSSFLSSYTNTVTDEVNTPMLPYKDAGIDVSATASDSVTQSTESMTTSSISVTKGSGVSDGLNGPACDYVGVDHDYDQIKIMLNPVALFTLKNNNVIEWDGYGYSSLDTIANGGDLTVPASDIVYVQVGCLNGDFSATFCNNQYGKAFARSWAAVEVWPSGQGPALTGPGTTAGTDLNEIAQADPYWNCTYQSGESSSACALNSTRYTRVEFNGSPLPAFPYAQAAPGGEPTSQTYNEYITTATTSGQDDKTSYSETYGLEASFGESLFGFGYKKTESRSQTLTTTNEWNNQFMSSDTTSASVTIFEAPCKVVGVNCSPAYPPGHAYHPVTCSVLSSPGAYGQGTSFLLYQDNLYGTFLMLPETY